MNDISPEQAIASAREIYNIDHWGEGYFDVNAAGRLVARPSRMYPDVTVDLYGLADEVRQAGLSLPVMVRFTDILRDRVDVLCGAFADAMAEDGYQGGFTAVYPIKVNQQRCVVQELVAHGGSRVGLEAGSKPELMAVMAQAEAGRQLIVCNGYKDREYIRLALIGRQLGHRVCIVLEKTAELDRVLEEAQDLGVRPMLGIRVRLASIGAGKWQNTGGDKSKFGLSGAQTLAAVERLRDAGLLDALAVLHFHLGSQIPNIRDIQRGLREGARYYAELRRLGAAIRCVDVGGGLGVDYEGTRSRRFCSMNYSIAEYAKNVVHILWETCTAHGLPHPDIITESGRAMTAHHAVLITNVIDTECLPDGLPADGPRDDDPIIIRDLWRGLEHIERRSPVEVYHDAGYWLSEAQAMYNHGVLTLEQRARAEQLYVAICRDVHARLDPASRIHREVLDELNEKLADKYFCNFSVFQSTPDVWAIDQIFPIMPLRRLDELPTRRAVIQDLTCDSDGRIDYYVDHDGVQTTLRLHEPDDHTPYLLGIFMVGAYQEILGDMHNLFGDANSINVEVRSDGSHRLSQPRSGDTVEEVLRYVDFDADELLRAYRSKTGAAECNGDRRSRLLKELEAGLSGYTYLEE